MQTGIYQALILCSLALITGCDKAAQPQHEQHADHSSPPAALAAVSDGGNFSAQLYMTTEATSSHDQAQPLKPVHKQQRLALGQYLDWVLLLEDTQGQPLYPAAVVIGGGMPAHGHGLPSQPQIINYLGDGKYLIEGLKFNMAGDWVLQLQVRSENYLDSVEFKLHVLH